jgi:hypothetical protein
MKQRLIFALSGLLAAPFCIPAHAEPINHIQLSYELTHNTNLSPKAVQMAFAGYDWAVKHHQVKNQDILTIVDFSVSGAKDRMYVINVKTGKILMGMPVTHGSGSGPNGLWATSFSNKPQSLKSSIGVFVTQNKYWGQHGNSLRIRGLESSNNNVYSRNIVIHPANYASRSYIRANHRPGTSWGCFAVDPQLSNQLIRYVQGGTVLYAYGPSREYLATTKIFNAQGSMA